MYRTCSASNPSVSLSVSLALLTLLLLVFTLGLPRFLNQLKSHKMATHSPAPSFKQ